MYILDSKSKDNRHRDAEELYSKFPKHKDVIQRAYRFNEGDTRNDLKADVYKAFWLTLKMEQMDRNNHQHNHHYHHHE